MGKPSKSRAKKNSASGQEGAEAHGGSGVAEQPTTATTSTPPQGDAADKVIRVYADGMCLSAVFSALSIPLRIPLPPEGCWCAGIFDMFHFGHARALEQAKKS